MKLISYFVSGFSDFSGYWESGVVCISGDLLNSGDMSGDDQSATQLIV